MRTRVLTSAVAGVLLLLPVSPGLARQDLVALLQDPTVLTVDPSTSTASGVLYLRNPGTADARVYLTATDFVSATTGKGISARTTFLGPADEAGGQILDVRLAAGATLPVRIEVANVWEAGESEAHILANAVSLGTARVRKYRVPFNVKLVTTSPDKPELAFVRGQPRQVALRNDDGMTYAVRASLSVKGHTFEAPSLVLPPNGSGAVEVDPPPTWFSWATGSVRDEQVDGLLTLRYEPPGTGSDPAWPVKVIPFTARLSVVPPFRQGLLGLGYILVLLLAGGACSLLSRYWVPSSLRRATLADGLARVAERIRALSDHTSSEIRVGLRVERQKLLTRLHSRWGFSPDLPELLTEIARRTDELDTHLDLVNALNDLWERLHGLYGRGLAPSKLSRIEEDVRSMGRSLMRIPCTAQELGALRTRVAGIVSAMDQVSAVEPEWVKRLEQRFNVLAAARSQLEQAYPPCGGLFAPWDSAWSAVKETEYDDLDRRIEILWMIRDTRGELSTASGAGRGAAKEFEEAVAHRNFLAARKAMGEIKQGVYREDVIAALEETDPAPWVSAPSTAREYAPIQFSVRFPDRRMDGCEALDAIACEWDFGHDGLKETGWQVSHFFPRPKKAKFWEPTTYTVTARFSDQGRRIGGGGGQGGVGAHGGAIAARLTVEALPGEGRSRTLAEVIQLAIALLIALLGLLAGAREQLQKLDFLAGTVALFLLGFGADSIRGVFAPAKGTQEPKSPGT